VFRPDGEDSWWGGDGRLHRLYRPKFVPAGELLDGARSILPPAVDLTLDPMRHRLLLAGTPAGVSCASEAVGYLDVPAPSASIDVTIVETARRRHGERGGHGVFDRDAPSAGPDTFFRSLRFDFEPESWLNSQLTGTDAFLGTSIRGGDPGTGGPLAGMVDVVLRSLSTEGEAEILANPSIVVTEGIPAYVASTIELPVTLFARSEFTTTYGTVSEHAGVRLEVTAVRIGADRLTLQIHPWVRQLTEAQGADGPIGAPVLAVRELSTTVSLADGEEFLLGGVASWQRARDGVGLPVPAGRSGTIARASS
jgi:type II secretory pathway component GspD/PulD (secretin)